MAGVEPGVVGEPVEHLGGDLRQQLREGLGVAEGVAHTAGEERVTGEQVRVAGGVVVEEGDRAGRVSGQPDDLQGTGADRDLVAVLDGLGVTRTPVWAVISSASGAPATTTAPVASTTAASARW